MKMKSNKIGVRMFFIVMLMSIFVVGFQTASAHDRPTIEHAIPKVPIVVDGVKMAPEEIKKFDGSLLYSLVDEKALSEGVLYVFTSLDGLNKHVDSQNQSTHSSMLTCTFSEFWGNTNYTGYYDFVPYGTWHNATGYYWMLGDATSVKTTNCNVYTKLYDGYNRSGNSLWLLPNRQIPDLDIYGWSDRTRSASVGL